MTQTLMRVWLAASELDPRRRLRRDEGQTIVEYALIIGIVAAVGFGIFTVIGGKISDVLNNLSTNL